VQGGDDVDLSYNIWSSLSMEAPPRRSRSTRTSEVEPDVGIFGPLTFFFDNRLKA
jgi:hypothetical protein